MRRFVTPWVFFRLITSAWTEDAYKANQGE